ncbi:P-loop containing nucleoside triphosphate hydrolase protein [Xylaria intraflava]|nr:P-loop containing nucleoside triphosphate hydrolase protein [Xylaria intraflava]
MPGRHAKGKSRGGRVSAGSRGAKSSQYMGDDVPKTNGEENHEEKSSANTQLMEETSSPSGNSEGDDDKAMKCEIKHLDCRLDDKEEQFFEERKDEFTKPEQRDWWQLFAFCVVRHLDQENKLKWTRMHVNPQPLRQFLKDIVGNSDPMNVINVNDMQITSPYYSLFYCREKLAEAGRERFREDEESMSQLNLLLSWIGIHFKQDIDAYENCITGDVKAISYNYLWTLYAPGTILYATVFGQHRAFRVYSSWYCTKPPNFTIVATYIDCDGEDLGECSIDFHIAEYTGNHNLCDLEVRPLSLHEDASKIRDYLLARGRKFERYIGGQHFQAYNGVAMKKIEKNYVGFNVTGRIMIDYKTYHRLNADECFHFRGPIGRSAQHDEARRRATGEVLFGSEMSSHTTLSDEDACLTNSTVRGFSFTVKRFFEFFVDKVSPIKWDEKCFDSLVLDATTKRTVQALVSMHSKERENMDDIVSGKGRGLVCVLHGPPGVGKTLTAECVAEYVQRPLYMVSSGDLGVSSTGLDESLNRVMDMAATWKAVLVIDEADVYLERRSQFNMHRNAMVSVFLRVLEYYNGILFLTTNRVNTFDDAFKSRIHIPIRYTDLKASSRLQIWRNFCDRVPGGVDIDETGLRTLAAHDLNGRQIKNIVKAAESLAAFDGVRLDFKKLETVTDIQARFEQDMTNVCGIDYTAPGEPKKNGDTSNMFL